MLVETRKSYENVPDANQSIGSSALTAEVQAQPLRKIAAVLDNELDETLLEVKRQVWKNLK